MPVWLTKIPWLGDVLKWVGDRVWPDKEAKELKELEIELEHARRGRVSPKMAFQYVGLGILALSALVMTLKFFYPDSFGDLPDYIGHYVSILAVAF